EKLAKAAGMERIGSFADLKKALTGRMDFFASQGCCVSDHALEFVMYYPATEAEVEALFAKRLSGEAVTKEEEYRFKTAFMQAVAREYHRRGWVMQLHYGCKRDNNTLMFEKLGPDTGYDCINNYAPSAQCADFLNSLQTTDELPKTILYSLNPGDNEYIGTILGCFQDSTAVAKIQQGSAWWFNDHKTGMTNQMISLANLGNLSGFVGMLTDSRSFLSYTRHEYFRRILCNLLGGWVENGEFPEDYEILGEIVKNISYYNAVRYFGFPL
ncbi:MAG: glucuronate isomerase, partial [Lachnospiraceae bacterium]|nr:glucuronate isomerase [Lachnospiraceae bacterium]